MADRPTLILFVGGLGGSGVEEMVAGAHRTIARDILERARDTGLFPRPIVVTDRPGLTAGWGGDVVEEPATAPFHFGQKLREVIHKYEVAIPFYVGGGALPLLTADRLGRLAQNVASSSSVVITNNHYSSDMVAFTPGSAIDAIALPSRDNPLARLLAEAGLREQSLPREAATQFDVDTPTDLAILRLHSGAGRHARAYLDSLRLDELTARLKGAVRVFKDKNAQLLVAGRVGSQVWACLEQGTACRVRLLSEERGLRADGREEVGEGATILGFYLQAVGPRRFFGDLARLGDAAFVDSRVIFQHMRLRPTQRDRFLSDLGEASQIEDPFIREFTQEAVAAPIPVVLGGHSLVSGGLLALSETYRLEAPMYRGRDDFA